MQKRKKERKKIFKIPLERLKMAIVKLERLIFYTMM